jgi:hypothetical protein
VATGVCSRCNRIIEPGGLFYSLSIKVSSDFDGVIKIEDKRYDVSKEFEKVSSYPEELLNEEVYREFRFVLCPRCKEIYCANPLNLPLSMPDQPAGGNLDEN